MVLMEISDNTTLSIMATVLPTTNHRHIILEQINRIKISLEQETHWLKQLKNLVANSERTVKRLKKNLASCEAAVAIVPPAFINKCPPEILSMIFKFSIVGNPQNIQRLLLVCKRWHNFILQDPQMWNTIHIRVPNDEWDVESWALSTSSFVKCCLERSRSTLLDLELDFTYMRTSRQQLIDRLDATCGFETDDDGVLRDWLASLDYDDLLDHDDLIGSCGPEHAVDLIDELIGPAGEIMERWGSLKILFPTYFENETLLLGIWSKLIYPAANLSSIYLEELDHLDDADPDEGTFLVPYFPKITCLTISDLRNWDTRLSFIPASLQRLSAETNLEPAFLRQLARFNQLTCLTLRGIYRSRVDDGNHSTPHSISLPLLQELVFVGHFKGLETIQFNLPKLETLTLQWGYSPLTQPNVRPSRVRWEPSELIFPRAPDVKSYMRILLLHYTDSEDVCVPLSIKGIILDLLKELENEGTLPKTWRILSFHDDGLEIVENLTIQRNR